MLNTWIMMGIVGIIFFIIYLHYLKTNKWKQIIKEKPVLCNNHRLSIIFTIAFTVLGIVIFIAGMILGKKILNA
jgi:heme/copper-type cytochrome/quinol oxidase subunit 2